jgi:DNA-directed RNA polymerase subunit RPC12/RpoP
MENYYCYRCEGAFSEINFDIDNKRCRDCSGHLDLKKENKALKELVESHSLQYFDEELDRIVYLDKSNYCLADCIENGFDVIIGEKLEGSRW